MDINYVLIIFYRILYSVNLFFDKFYYYNIEELSLVLYCKRGENMKFRKTFCIILAACLLMYSCNSNSDDTVTEIPVLSSIKVTTMPQKTTYYEDQLFAADGMVVTATYSDNTTKVVTDYTYSPAGKLKLADTAITITYTEEAVTVTDTINITVLEKIPEYNITFDYTTPKSNYSTFSITGKSDAATYEETEGIITLTSTEEKSEYTLTGYFKGQIINNTKGTVLNLNGAYLENTDGTPVIVSTKKLEISAKENTENYIVSTGNASGKPGTIYCYDAAEDKSKNLELGGKGICYILGLYHGIKADEVKAKGSGTYYITGTSKGSAINCNTFIIEEEKTVTLVLGNAKNSIKADESISIFSGTLWFENVTTGMKTDTLKDDDTKEYFIDIANCKIYTKDVDTLQATEVDSYTQNNVIITNVEQ